MALGPVSLAFLAERTGAVVQGDGDTRIHRVATLKAAVEGEIAFLANPRYRRDVAASRASALILGRRDQALVHLQALERLCGQQCEEYQELRRALDAKPQARPKPRW